LLVRKKLIVIIFAAVIVSIVAFVGLSIPTPSSSNTTTISSNTTSLVNKTLDNYTGRIIHATFDIEGKPESYIIPIDRALFDIKYGLDSKGNILSATVNLKPEYTNFYNQVGFFNRTANAVIVYPIFTQAAYGENGFYDYYYKTCDSRCLKVKIPDHIGLIYQTGGRAFAVLNLLKYDYVTDVDVDKNPDILKKYDKVIMLHNEYVTQKEFDAITSYPNVIYLYPNALYAKITVNYTDDTIALVRGHGYPDPSVLNGFNWKFDNSKYEYNITCDNWEFYPIDNGKMLNCYPGFRIYFDKSLLQALIS